MQGEDGENEKGLSCIKHLWVTLQGQKHADKLLFSSLECECRQQFCGNCSAKFLKIKMLLLWFFHLGG